MQADYLFLVLWYKTIPTTLVSELPAGGNVEGGMMFTTFLKIEYYIFFWVLKTFTFLNLKIYI